MHDHLGIEDAQRFARAREVDRLTDAIGSMNVREGDRRRLLDELRTLRLDKSSERTLTRIALELSMLE